MDDPEPSMVRFHEVEWDDYDQLRDAFEWTIPDRFNVASYVCDRWADRPETATRTALYRDRPGGTGEEFSFRDLRTITDRLAQHWRIRGLGKGDRIGINLPQKPETVMAHVAAWKLGAVSVPLSTLFGPDALRYRLQHCGARACVVDSSNLEAFRSVRDQVSTLEEVLVVDEPDRASGEGDFWDALGDPAGDIPVEETSSEDEFMIIYTSGTTGKPKGVVYAHRTILGQLPMFLTAFCNMRMGEEDVHWTPGEWAWMGTMIAQVLPALFYGKPVVAQQRRGFDPEQAFQAIEQYRITHALIHPTAIRQMMQVPEAAASRELDHVRVIVTGGEDVGSELIDWGGRAFGGAPVHNSYGQSESCGIIADCTALFPQRQGTLGKAMPGTRLRVVDPETAQPLREHGGFGEIAARYGDHPAFFLRYLEDPGKTREKIRDGWLLTEDLGRIDEEGNVSFHSRKDDVIISSGRKLSPGEIEEALERHEDVLESGVIGVPDAQRTEVPRAYVRLRDGVSSTSALKDALKTYVRERLARFQYPHQIVFVDELPKTVTGKIKREALRERFEDQPG